MLTNTFTPHVGGVARSVQTTADGLRSWGHDVRVIAPEFDQLTQDPEWVIRVPAWANVQGSGFSAALPKVANWFTRLYTIDFQPDIIHSHHPFLLGDHAVELSKKLRAPLVFTWHTKYEEYAHHFKLPGKYVGPVASAVLKKALNYTRSCSRVIAPSTGILEILKTRGVTAPISVVPTGINPAHFQGNRVAARRAMNLENRFVVGHVGRLTKEKNLRALAAAVKQFLHDRSDAVFLLIGDGAERDALIAELPAAQVHYIGVQSGAALADAYAAMDVFAFTSKSETQGMVLAEAILSHVPIVAIPATGVNDVVKSTNGYLADTLNKFVSKLHTAREAPPDRNALPQTVQAFTADACWSKLLRAYAETRRGVATRPRKQSKYRL